MDGDEHGQAECVWNCGGFRKKVDTYPLSQGSLGKFMGEIPDIPRFAVAHEKHLSRVKHPTHLRADNNYFLFNFLSHI